MCIRDMSPETAAIERGWHVGPHNPWKGRTEPIDVFPGCEVPFIRVAKDSAEPKRELVIGQWNLMPSFAKELRLSYATCNARSEELLDKASYKLPWLPGQRCVIRAAVFFEPNWESGRHIRWAFELTDGMPWAQTGR